MHTKFGVSSGMCDHKHDICMPNVGMAIDIKNIKSYRVHAGIMRQWVLWVT